ncbi:MarR family winged helix-turn-helix transcriptional regulator [Neisseria chenwenguii]|uniref:MarR family winged helix-turn-helix transcriptional regulator n=1 Tax=Neisseria chenwenguii TaxID=1853278 RepID=UPI000F4E50E6|nr:MarR family transcriptional regulator [Neisseria chenwenguii]ROV56003.1 MarR family transcriptional regulator [Neisseria chenwenguii]
MYEQLKLNNQLCFPLYALSKEITRRYTPFLDALDLTYPQYLVMMVLWEHGEQSVSEIGAKLYLDSGTLTPLLKRLQAKGLIERRRSSTDERSVKIRLTKTGQGLEHQAAAVPQQLAGCLKLDIAQAEALRAATQKILAENT